MRKLLVLFIAATYFLAGTGFLLKGHFCMGEFVEAVIDWSGKHEMEMCGGGEGSCSASSDAEESDDSCCEQKSTFVKKVQAEQFQVSNILFLIGEFVLPTTFHYTFWAHVTTPTVKEKFAYTLQKPPPKSLPLFLTFRNLRI